MFFEPEILPMRDSSIIDWDSELVSSRANEISDTLHDSMGFIVETSVIIVD